MSITKEDTLNFTLITPCGDMDTSCGVGLEFTASGLELQIIDTISWDEIRQAAEHLAIEELETLAHKSMRELIDFQRVRIGRLEETIQTQIDLTPLVREKNEIATKYAVVRTLSHITGAPFLTRLKWLFTGVKV